MNQYVEIIRPGNVIMAIIAVILVAILAKSVDIPIILAMLAVFFAMSAGNVINDYFDYKIEDVIEKVKKIIKIDGRCEILGFRTKYKIVLDYAHTENALKNILTYLNKIKKRRIITITGAAGGRYHEKRSKIGKIVLSMSDLVIFTMDDPRYESVEEIIDEMVSTSSLKNYVRIIDREQAIMYALKNAKKDDIILIAGKGKDTYMAIKDKYIPYSDYEVVEKYINSVNKSK